MTILSDNEIKARCLKPMFVVYQGDKDKSDMQMFFVNEKVKEFVDAQNMAMFGTASFLEARGGVPESILSTRWVGYRDITEEDLKTWKPLISDFVDGQVKTYRREPTKAEKQLWDSLHDDSSADMMLPDSFINDNIDNGLEILEKAISHGTSSYGYDLRAGFKYKIFTNVMSAVVDPKNLDSRSFIDVEADKVGEPIIIPPNSFILTHSLERIQMPRDITGIVLGKSTYARCGVNCLATPLEAGWEGYVTLEFTNGTPLPVKFYPGEGCCQVLFFKGDNPCKVSYADRKGKYQDQPAEVVLPTV